jgi:hypothetical protein
LLSEHVLKRRAGREDELDQREIAVVAQLHAVGEDSAAVAGGSRARRHEQRPAGIGGGAGAD